MKARSGKPPGRGSNSTGPFHSQFKEYAKALDEKNEKRERIVRASRDVTQKSKKLIFALHRINEGNRQSVIQDASETASKIRKEIATRIAKELDAESYYVFHRAFTPGIQEYIEARTFLNYLQEGTLLSLEKLQEEVSQKCEENSVHKLHIDSKDYLLGIADLTGELMRRAVATGPESQSICVFLKELENAFVSTSQRHSLRGRDLSGKISVLKTSVQKVERSCFGRVIREAEMKDLDSSGNLSTELHQGSE